MASPRFASIWPAFHDAYFELEMVANVWSSFNDLYQLYLLCVEPLIGYHWSPLHPHRPWTLRTVVSHGTWTLPPSDEPSLPTPPCRQPSFPLPLPLPHPHSRKIYHSTSYCRSVTLLWCFVANSCPIELHVQLINHSVFSTRNIQGMTGGFGMWSYQSFWNFIKEKSMLKVCRADMP